MSRHAPDGPSSAPAWALVCACANPRPAPVQAARIAALCAGSPDWTAVRALAERHRVTPLVATALRSVCPQAVPADVLDALTRRLHQITARSVYLATHLHAALDRLDAAGIAASAFKGPALASAAFGRLGLRTFDDLDLLVAREQIGPAASVLRADGYRPAVALDEAQAAALIAQARPCALVQESARVTLDLHWSVTPRYFLSRLHVDRLHEARASVLVLGRPVPGLSSETLLAVLAVHGHKHCWSRLIWVADIAALLTASDRLDWDRVAAYARAWRCERMIGLALTLAADLLGVALPDAARRAWTAEPAVRRLAARARARLQANVDAGTDIAAARFHLAGMESWPDRLRYVRFAAEPSEADWHGTRVPAGASLLYYPLRAVRVLASSFRPRRS